MIRFVFFDAGGTLVERKTPLPELWLEIARQFGFFVPLEELRRWFVAVFSSVYLGEERYDSEALRAVARRCVYALLELADFNGDREAFFEAYYSATVAPVHWTVCPGVFQTVSELAERSIPAGIISNWDSRLEQVLRGLDLAQHFDPIVVSAIERIEKPDVRLFHLALEKVKIPAEQVVYVGNSYTNDYLPARKTGMRVYLLDSLQRYDVDSITSLAQLVPRLNELIRRPPDETASA